MRDPEMPKLPSAPTGFKVWFAAVALTIVGVLLWAVIAVVNHYT